MTGREVVIVGVHATEQAKVIPDRTPFEICVEAAFGALDDAGLSPRDVDGCAMEWPGPGGSFLNGLGDAGSWARILGGPFTWMADGWFDTVGARAVCKAAAAISYGLCDTVLVGGGTAGAATSYAGRTVSNANPWYEMWGSMVPSNFALVAQRHMHLYGTTEEQIAEVAATIRNNGHVNPEAVMYGRGPYTVDDVLSSRMIATPLRLLMICLRNQGGAALVMTTAERARDLRKTPVKVLGTGMEFRAGAWSDPNLTYPKIAQVGTEAVRRAFGRAGVRPSELDVLALYDMNAFEVIRQFELLGLCGPGEGGPFVEGGTIARDGTYPTNPDGGLLSYSWNLVHQQTLKVVECVRQLRGEAVNQIPDARLAVATNAGSASLHYELVVLGRE